MTLAQAEAAHQHLNSILRQLILATRIGERWLLHRSEPIVASTTCPSSIETSPACRSTQTMSRKYLRLIDDELAANLRVSGPSTPFKPPTHLTSDHDPDSCGLSFVRVALSAGVQARGGGLPYPYQKPHMMLKGSPPDSSLQELQKAKRLSGTSAI